MTRRTLSRLVSSRLTSTAIPAAFIACGALFAACGSDEDPAASVSCGPGTQQVESQCLPVAAEAGAEDTTPTADSGPAGDAADTAPVAPDLAPKFDGVQSVSPSSATTLQLTWKAATDLLTPTELIKYRVYVGTTAGGENFGAAQIQTPPGATGALISGLTAGTKYFVVVRAVNLSALEDKNKTELSGTPATDVANPTFAGAKTAETADGAGVKLTWDAATDDLTGAKGIQYVIFWSTKTGTQTFGLPHAIAPAGSTEYVVRGLPPEQTLFFVVRARDAAGNRDENKVEVSAKSGADKQAPTFGGCVAAAPKNASTITVQWGPATDDVTKPDQMKYTVYGGKSASDIDYNAPLGSFTGGTTGDVSGLTSATTYFLVCRAADESANQETNKSAVVAATLDDATPPVFGGLTTVTEVTTTSAKLTWTAASDDKTPVGEIVYDIYDSATATGFDYAAPPKASSPKGATSMTLTGLSPASKHFIVVRARDLAGNHDANTTSKPADTLVSFSINVQPLFTASCATGTCHRGISPAAGLLLIEGSAYSNTVNVLAVSGGGLDRVEPGQSANSYLYKKVIGLAGTIMPPPESGIVLTQDQKDMLKAWMDQGALNN